MKNIIKITILILVIALIFCVSKAFPQSIGLGLGYSSSGDAPLKLSVKDVKKCGVYIKLINDGYATIEDDVIPKDRHQETILGVSYRIQDMVSVTAGAGFNKTTEYYRIGGNLASNLHSESYTGSSLEVGASVDFLRFNRCTLCCDFGISSFSGVNTMLSINIKLPQ